MADDQPHEEEPWGQEDGLQPYEYKPISPNEIRCLVLEPGRNDEPLGCTLEVRELADDPDFEAISYVWGDLNRCHNIKCDGGRVCITTNLRDALRQCRLPDRRRVLWADSICINQDDDREKSHQVSVMSKVYSQASRVLICLGPDRTGDCAPQAQAFLRDFNEMFENTLENIIGKYDSFPRPSDDNPILNDPRWPSIESLAEHPWFMRGWVVQEAGLARDALVLWGEVRINWRWLLRFVLWSVRRVGPDNEPFDVSFWPMRYDAYLSRYREEVITLYVENDLIVPDLLATLDEARWLCVTDDRDRIYAFLGLPQAADVRDHLHIDYKKSVSQVYQDFARVYLDRTQDLSLLHYVQPTEDTLSAESDCPSWAPLWQHHYYNITLHVTTNKKIFPKNAPTSLFYSAGANTLVVRALIADSIAFLSSPLSWSMTIGDMAAVWREVRGHQGGSIYKDFAPITAFLETMMCGREPAYLDAEQLKTQTEAFIDGLAHGVPDAGRGGSPASSASDSDSHSDSGSDELVEPASLLRRHARVNVHERRIAVTQRGYYCLVPRLAREGDTCAIIYGTAAPFILRSAGEQDCYKVVGEAFAVSSRKFEDDGFDFPYRVGCGSDANEDWVDWDLDEKDIFLC